MEDIRVKGRRVPATAGCLACSSSRGPAFMRLTSHDIQAALLSLSFLTTVGHKHGTSSYVSYLRHAILTGLYTVCISSICDGNALHRRWCHRLRENTFYSISRRWRWVGLSLLFLTPLLNAVLASGSSTYIVPRPFGKEGPTVLKLPLVCTLQLTDEDFRLTSNCFQAHLHFCSCRLSHGWPRDPFLLHSPSPLPRLLSITARRYTP